MTVMTSAGQTVGGLKKVTRESPTLGKKPPQGAVVLFDGKQAFFGNPTVTDQGELMAGTESLAKFGDHHLHVEFRTPFRPAARGQARGNSGVYLQNRYECQVLDSFGLEGENNECGGIYQIAKPAVNACFPPLTWQTYDVELRRENGPDGKATISVKHNGIVIHEKQESRSGAPKPFVLQGHGNPLQYRNIWLEKLD